MGTNWFMPALVKSRPGESGMRLAEGTMRVALGLEEVQERLVYLRGCHPGRLNAKRPGGKFSDGPAGNR